MRLHTFLVWKENESKEVWLGWSQATTSKGNECMFKGHRKVTKMMDQTEIRIYHTILIIFFGELYKRKRKSWLFIMMAFAKKSLLSIGKLRYIVYCSFDLWFREHIGQG